jgi:hypothetical protein
MCIASIRKSPLTDVVYAQTGDYAFVHDDLLETMTHRGGACEGLSKDACDPVKIPWSETERVSWLPDPPKEVQVFELQSGACAPSVAHLALSRLDGSMNPPRWIPWDTL